MDKNIVVTEESCNKRNESLASASKGSASLVQIESIAIDINCPEEDIESPQNEHFSMRDFVSEMRKKDKKKCHPFGSEDHKHDEGGMELPPLSVPRFRWWQCPKCVPEFGDQKSRHGKILADKSDTVGSCCCQNRNAGENQGLLRYSTQNIDDGETKFVGGKIITYKQQCMDGYGAAANARSTEVGTSHDEFSDKEYSTGINPSTEPDKSKNASSSSDEAIASSALPHKWKPKLRSLADIINEEQNLLFEHSRTKSQSSAQTEGDSNSQPQSEVSSDAAKSTKMVLRKRKKTVTEDDRGSLETGPTNFAAKKVKSSTLDSEAENIGIASKRVEISESGSERDGPTTWPAVRITEKASDRKIWKPKALHINRKMRQTDVENRTAVQTTSSSYTHYANLIARFGNTRNVGPLFEKTVSGQETGDLSKGKRPQGGDHNAFVSLSDMSSGDCADGEKVGVNLSLGSSMGFEMNSRNQESSGKYTGIPDLNESFDYSTHVMEGEQDMSGSCIKEPGREGKGKSIVFEKHQGTHNMYMNKTVDERGPSSDDIPMEIVELLAKNQHDRELDNSRKHLGPNGPVNFPYFNTSVTSGNTGLGQGFLNFPQTQYGHLSPLMAGDQGTPLYPGHNHMSGPRLGEEGVDLVWPPRRKNVTFDLTGNQSDPVQSDSLNDQSYRGKAVSDINNPESLLKGGRIWPGRIPVGSTDAYSNETIPAMQLLSLMDQGVVSGSPFNPGPSNFLDRPFSPCNNHPGLNQSDQLVGSSLFGKSDRINDFPDLLNGACFSGESSKKSPSQDQMPLLQEGSSRAVDPAGPVNLAGQPSRSDLRLEVCTLNRNPADFSIPDAKNKFMISGKDLKPRKGNSSGDRARPANPGGTKRQKPRKDSSTKKAREE